MFSNWWKEKPGTPLAEAKKSPLGEKQTLEDKKVLFSEIIGGVLQEITFLETKSNNPLVKFVWNAICNCVGCNANEEIGEIEDVDLQMVFKSVEERSVDVYLTSQTFKNPEDVPV